MRLYKKRNNKSFILLSKHHNLCKIINKFMLNVILNMKKKKKKIYFFSLNNLNSNFYKKIKDEGV